MEVLEKIRQFAHEAHGEQKRKYSQLPYIIHPVAVMTLCREYTDEVPVLAAALLHDVLEDTPVTSQQLHAYLFSVLNRSDANRTLQLVKDLTDIYTKANFPQLNRKKRRQREAERLANADPMAQTIKYADLIDNCLDIVRHDKDFGEVFVRESANLLGHMTSGDPRLYRRACDTVAESKKRLRGYMDNQPEASQ